MKTRERTKGQTEEPASNKTPAPFQPGTAILLFKSMQMS